MATAAFMVAPARVAVAMASFVASTIGGRAVLAGTVLLPVLHRARCGRRRDGAHALAPLGVPKAYFPGVGRFPAHVIHARDVALYIAL